MSHTIASFDKGLLRLIGDKQNNEKAKTIIEKEDLYNVTDSLENTLLHVAAEKNAEITRYLINSGNNVFVKNVLGKTPLLLAINAPCSSTFEVLLEAIIELQNGLGIDTLHLLGFPHYVDKEILRVFLQKLLFNCSNNKEQVAEKLIVDQWPLKRVVELNDADITRIVLQRSYAAKIDTFDKGKYTALHRAVALSDIENVKALLEYEANVNILDKQKRLSPMCYLYTNGIDHPNERLEILKMLLGRGAIIRCNNPRNKYEAYKIFKYANGETIKLLLQFDIDKSTDFDRLAALKNLAENENSAIFQVEIYPEYEQCVQLLLEGGADVVFQMVSSPRNERITIFDLIWRRRLFWLVELVIDHLALQEILRTTPITETISTQINSSDRFETHFESSKQQLSIKVYKSLTLLDLLALITDEKFEMYVRNGEFILKTQDAVSAMSGHRYFAIRLQRRLSKAQTSATLKTAAARIISKIIGISYDGFPLIADYIVRYLDHEDMKNLKKISM